MPVLLYIWWTAVVEESFDMLAAMYWRAEYERICRERGWSS
jgi:hypothetical protein